jgi:hypothetical protein
VKISMIARAMVVLAAIAVGVQAQGTKTLGWFGNSFSDAGHIFDMTQKMTNCQTCGVTSGLTLNTTPYIYPSCWLSCHEVQWPAFAKIDSAHYNYVVAQDNVANFMVLGGSGTQKNNADQLTTWATHAKNAGGKLVIEEMWLRVGTFEMTQTNQNFADRWYDSVARATNSILVPCGHAWFSAYQANPNLEFIEPNWNDAMHPGSFTAYLNTCCFFAALTGKSPVGDTWQKVWFGDTITLSAADAAFAQQKAWEAYQYFNPASRVSAATVPIKATGGFTANYSPENRMLAASGVDIRSLRIVGPNGVRVAVMQAGETRAKVPGGLLPGLYFVKAQSAGAWKTATLRIVR